MRLFGVEDRFGNKIKVGFFLLYNMVLFRLRVFKEIFRIIGFYFLREKLLVIGGWGVGGERRGGGKGGNIYILIYLCIWGRRVYLFSSFFFVVLGWLEDFLEGF